MIVAGVMSGTSADGIDVALIRVRDIRPRGTLNRSPNFKFLGHAEYPYPSKVRQAVLAAMNAPHARVADLARLNFLLGELYADAVRKTRKQFRARIDLVGCHGQTLYHQGQGEHYLGRNLACTWQTGEGSVIAGRVGIPVVSDFRPADLAAGGKGAPLVPYLDYLLYRDKQVGRIVQNLGGIGNLTAIPPNATPGQIMAFDTGPGNMVIDALMERLFDRPYDRDGDIGASGMVLDPVIRELLREPFFKQRPPKTAGREEFGREFVEHFLKLCEGASKQDIVTTATAFTAESIRDSLNRFVIRGRHRYKEYVVSGGGAKNATMLAMLANKLKPMGLSIRLSDEFGIPSAAKEAVAFALMAYQTWNRQPSNIPAATGAKRPAILGKISYV